jgi:hypothetical protein
MASKLQGTIEFLKDFGLFDVILPFLLVFAVVFAVLEKTSILGKDKKNLNSIVALVLGLLTIAANKVIMALTNALPNIVLMIIISLSFLLMIGIFLKEGDLDLEEKHSGWYKAFSFVMLIGVIFIFLGAWVTDSGISVLSYIFAYMNSNFGGDLIGGIVLIAVVVGVIAIAVKGSKSGDD